MEQRWKDKEDSLGQHLPPQMVMNSLFISPTISHCSVVVLFCFLFWGCATSPNSYTEEQLANNLRAIHQRLGVIHDELWIEISNSVHYSRDQAIDLKRRIGELVVAYEELSVKAGCHERHFPSCQELFTAGLRFNSGILDAEHPNLTPLPPIVKGYRLN